MPSSSLTSAQSRLPRRGAILDLIDQINDILAGNLITI
jgi:hypothetical protein